MSEHIFEGSGVAIITPMNPDGSVNFDELGRIIDFQIENGTDAIITCGTTGESATLNNEEHCEVIEYTIKKVAHRVPVIAGAGSNDTNYAIGLSKHAQTVGADAILSVTPYYNKCTQNGLIEHYTEIAKNVSLPIIIYNVPGRTSVNIEPKTCLELSKIENIVAIKEASGNLSQVAEIAHLCGENLHIYSGNDDQIIPVLSLGGIGVISVLSNIFPEYTHDMVQNFFDGNIEQSTKMQLNAIPLIKALFSEVNPIPVKSALNLLGYNYGIPRLPLTQISKEKEELLKNELLKFSN